eukprot:scaffold2643_cov117-Isochrysis_galbana.AAC.3
MQNLSRRAYTQAIDLRTYPSSHHRPPYGYGFIPMKPLPLSLALVRVCVECVCRSGRMPSPMQWWPAREA